MNNEITKPQSPLPRPAWMDMTFEEYAKACGLKESAAFEVFEIMQRFQLIWDAAYELGFERGREAASKSA